LATVAVENAEIWLDVGEEVSEAIEAAVTEALEERVSEGLLRYGDPTDDYRRRDCKISSKDSSTSGHSTLS
jgi:hypothetical protein